MRTAGNFYVFVSVGKGGGLRFDVVVQIPAVNVW
jgi:hypothetical protein